MSKYGVSTNAIQNGVNGMEYHIEKEITIIWDSAGTGIQACLRSMWRFPCGFESHLSHNEIQHNNISY